MNIPEINYKIISYLHPYYLQAYCLSSNELIDTCNFYLYDLLQIWVMPDKSTQYISSYFPNITLKQVVDLSLVYYPIPESIGKYDLYTLVYHACRTNQSDLSYLFDGYQLDFRNLRNRALDSITNSKFFDLKLVSWIAYKFNRIDVLDKLYETLFQPINISSNNTFENMIMVKIGGKATRLAQPIINSLSFFNNLQMLLSPEEILEAIIIAHRARCVSKEDEYYLLDYLSSPTEVIPAEYISNRDRYLNFVGTLINTVGVNKLDEILLRYYPAYIPSRLNRIYPNYPELLTGKEGSALWYYNHPEYTQDIDRFIAYYLTSGDYIRYISALNLGAKLDLESETIIGSGPMNYISMNQDFEVEFRKKIHTAKQPVILEPSTYLPIDIYDPYNSLREFLHWF